MGTDLHALVEVSHHDEPWHTLAGMKVAFDAPRNYALFSLLADVNNRSGRIAPTWQEPHTEVLADGDEVEVPGYWYNPDNGGHDPIVPIAPPRGVPDDATLEWRANVAVWQARRADPITSWLTLEEIAAADWDQVVWREGIVTDKDYELFRDEHVPPSTWAEHAAGEGLRIVTPDEYEAGERGEHSTSVKLRWCAGPLRDCTDSFMELIRDLTDSPRPGTRLRFMLLFES
jgi:hypothetical protein